MRFLNRVDTREKFWNGMETAGGSPQQLAAMVKSAMTRMAKIIKDAAIRSE